MATVASVEDPSRVAGRGRPRRLRRWLVVAGAMLLGAVVASLSIGQGGVVDPVTAVMAVLTDDPSRTGVVVTAGRLPRTLFAVVVGAALAVAGVVGQALTRNPLGSPSVLGMVHGSAFAVVAVAALAVATPARLAAAAVAGAVVATVLVFAVAATRGRAPSPSRLVLAGLGLTGLSLAGAQTLLVLDEVAFDQSRRWITGSLVDRQLVDLVPLLPLFAVGLVLAWALAAALDVLAADDEIAVGLGQRVGWTRLAAGAAMCLLTGAAVAAGGPIVFVGLVAPHAARRLVGGEHRALLPLAAVLGALLLVVADVAARRLLPGTELPAGALTALLGGPLFVLLARRREAVS